MPKITDETAYLLKGIPRATWDAAKDKAANARPPLSMRWVIIQLLERWIQHGKSAETAANPAEGNGTARRRVKAPRQPKVGKAKPSASGPMDAPDLADSF